MKIESAKYNEQGGVVVVADGREWTITPQSRFWSHLQEWEAKGNTISPYTPYVPTSEEIAAAESADIERQNKMLDEQRALRALAVASWHNAKGTVPAQALTNPYNYREWLKSLM